MGAFPTEIERTLKSLHASWHNPSEAGQILTDLVSLGDGLVGTLIVAHETRSPRSLLQPWPRLRRFYSMADLT